MSLSSPFSTPDWWTRDGPFQTLHDINPLRLSWLQGQAGGLRGKRLLDWGCGGGIFAEAAAREGARVTGYDMDAVALEAAREHAAAESLGLDYRERPPPEGERFDVVTAFEVLEHVENPAALVADMACRLAPGGLLALSTINRTARAWGLMIVGLEVLGRQLPLGTHEYGRFVRPAELAGFCRDGGLRVTDVAGLVYSFFGKHYFFSERDTSVNYFLAARRPHD